MSNLIKKTAATEINKISSDFVLGQINDSLEKYALKNGSKGIRAVAHSNDENVPVKVTVKNNRQLNGWYSKSFLKSLNLIN